MRHPIIAKGLSIGLLALTAAGCASPGGNNMAGNDMAGNDSNAAAPAEPAPENAADANAAAPAGNESAGASESYRASGTEPFWSLTIGSQMVYDSANGPDVSVTTPPPRQTRAGPMYVTPEMTVRINQFQRCTEASGAESHDTVTVTIGAQTVTGCGGETTRAAE